MNYEETVKDNQQIITEQRVKRQAITHEQKEVTLLLAKNKEYLVKRQKLIKPDEPVVFLQRTWGDVEVYEGIKGSTFIIPSPNDKKKQVVEIGQAKHLIKGQRVAYLENSGLKTMRWGGDTLKCYFIDEEDAKPWGSDNRVWSETLEMVVSAILINYRNMLARQQNNNQVIVDIIKWGGIIFLGYLMVKYLFLDKQTAATVATTAVNNFTAGGVAT